MSVLFHKILRITLERRVIIQNVWRLLEVCESGLACFWRCMNWLCGGCVGEFVSFGSLEC